MFSLRDLPKFEYLETLATRFPVTDAASIESCLVTLRVASDLLSALDVHMARHGITQGRFIVLMLLQRNSDQTNTPSALAEKAGVTRATMTGLLDVLERDGLVRREQAAEDRRNVFIHLTDKGRAFLDGMLPDYFQRIAGIMKNLEGPEKKQLVQLLSKIHEGLGEFLKN